MKSEDVQEQLRLAHLYKDDRPITCNCKPFNKEALLVVTGQKFFFLKSYPNRARFHSETCNFYSSSDGDGNTVRPAIIQDTESGDFSVRLINPLSKKQQNQGDNTNRTQTSGRVSRNKTTLLGFLYHLWTQSSLNNYRPDKKYGKIFSKALSYNVNHTTSKRLKGNEFIFLINPKGKFDENNKEYKKYYTPYIYYKKHSSVDYPIVIGELDSFYESNGKKYITLKGFGNNILISEYQYDRYINSFGANSAFNHNPKGKDIMIFNAHVTKSQAKKSFPFIKIAEGTDVQSMPVTKEYIPYDSSYEKDFIKMLVKNKCNFLKPMSVNNDLEMMPDFELKNSYPYSFVEIWGMQNNDQYNQRKQKKIELYKKKERA